MTTTISPKFQIVIPKAVRESMNLKPGTKVRVFNFNGMIQVVPIRGIKSLKGSLKGMDTTIIREPDREI